MIKPLCKYKNIFGKPKDGLHSIRIFNIAIIDLILTIIGSFIISKWMNWNFFNTIIVLLIVGIILHRVFCVNTTINKLIFGIIN